MALSKYQRIWIAANGPIPRDKSGRSYEIHHINGDHEDNRLENLLCCSIKEHYDIHFKQGDFFPCISISKRMAISPQEHSRLCSELSSLVAKRRLEDGTHNFYTLAKERVKAGTHNWQDSEAASLRNIKRVKEGRHNLLKTNPNSPNNIKMMSTLDGRITIVPHVVQWNKKNPAYVDTWVKL